MDQHPVPQNISSYEFRLVGDMTLKQFFQLAGGAGIGFLFFKMPLPFFLKWPLVFISVLTGILLAFVPVGGRPFSQWLIAFVKAVYSPTEFSWHFTPALAMTNSDLPVTQTKSQSALDKLEDQILGRVSQFFTQTKSSPAIPVIPSPLPSTPSVAIPDVPAAPPIPPAPPTPTETTFIKSANIPHKPLVVTEVVEAPTPTPPPPAATPPPPQPVYAAPEPAQLSPTVSHAPSAVATSPAVTTNNMPMPERPNIITGLVTDSNSLPVEGAIIEISQAQTGIPVRALRANKLGQFQTATPLNRGDYVIAAEKDNLHFAHFSITVSDKIIPPIIIGATA